MQSGPVLGPGSLISENTRIIDLVFQDGFYAVYSAESAASGARVGITEYFPADLVARAPGGGVLLRSLELKDLFNLGRDRFMAEIKALSALHHPNIIRFDGALSDHGTAFALHAPEEGQSITDLKSSKEPLSQDELDASVKQLVSALELLHSRNLIHANITPDTVILRPQPLLIRFGATRSFLAAKVRKVNLAVTPGYSAPELHFSDAKPHGPLCDIFSLAAVLYYLVTGRHPINVIARGLGHTMPPAAAAPLKFRPEFLAAIDRGLELDPERRPPHIKAFGQMLLGMPEKKVFENKKPGLQMATNLAEGAQHQTPPSAFQANGPTHMIHNPPTKKSPSITAGETDDHDDDDDHEDQDFESSWWDLGLGRLLVLAVSLALLIPAGSWMLQSQIKKEPAQSARLEPEKGAPSQASRSSVTAPREQPALDAARAAMAKPLARIDPTSAPEDREVRTPAELEPSSEMKPPEKAPAGEAGLEKPGGLEPKSDLSQIDSAEETETSGSSEKLASEPTEPSTDRNRATTLNTTKTNQLLTEPQQPPSAKTDRVRKAAIEKAQPTRQDTLAGAPAQVPEKQTLEKAPTQRVAKADPVAPPLPEASATSPAGFRFRDCDFCPPLVVVPKGEFQMGSGEHPHEKPAHKVKISRPFAIGQYEVTYAEWDRCVDAGACRYRPEHQGSPSAPVGNLSWDDVSTYLKWMSEKTGQIYRLPSEAEWEYAARAGTNKRFWWGDEADSGKANCSDCKSGADGPSKAGTYKPNPFGLYDTAGNMAEWVQDCWNDSYQGAPADGSAWEKGNCGLRALRGGSYGNKSTYIRSSARFRYDRDVRYEANGFRVLRELP